MLSTFISNTKEWYFLIFFVIELVALYFISRISINQLFRVLHHVIRHTTSVFVVISLIFLPGTIVHELSHFFMAIILFLRVRDLNILPSWEGNYIKLGSVIYEKQDVIRGILVGIAPVIVGILTFWVLSAVDVFATSNIWLKILFGYLIFVLSSTMFSSRQDLVDIVYIIPVFIIIAIVAFVFQLDIIGWISKQKDFIENLRHFLYAINGYMLFSLAIHIGFITITHLPSFFKKR